MWAAVSISAPLCLSWRHVSYGASWVCCQTFQAVYQCKDNKILLNMAATLPVVLPFSAGLCSVPPLSSAARTTCLATPERGRADVSPEEQGLNWPRMALGSALVPAVAVLWGFSPLRGHSSGATVERGGHGSCGWLLGMSHTAHVPDKDGHYSSECHGSHAAEVSPWAILKMLSHAHFLVHQALVSTMGR